MDGATSVFRAHRHRWTSLLAIFFVIWLRWHTPDSGTRTVFVPAPSIGGGSLPSIKASVTGKDHTIEAESVTADVRTKTILGSSRATSASFGATGATAAAALVLAAKSACSGRKPLALNSGAGMAQTDNTGKASFGVVLIFGWIAVMWLIQHHWVPFPGTDQSAEYFPLVATFIAGYMVIVFEEQLEVNKAPTALVLGILIWCFIGTGVTLPEGKFDELIKESLEEVSEVVFFLLGALTIVEVMDAHKGFDIITKQITQTKARDLLFVVGVLTFFLSSVLNNLTVVIVMIALLQKVVKDDDLRLRLGGIVVVLSNAGGAWTPIGDITTTMMYIGGQVTTVPLLVNLFFPSILCLIGTLGFEMIKTDGSIEFERPPAADDADFVPQGQNLVFYGGLFGMISVPVFTAVTQCPAWAGMMFVLGMIGIVTYLLHGHHHESEKYTIKGALERVEVPDCLFFLGVLFAVAGLERVGILKEFAGMLNSLVSNEVIIATLLGFSSAVVDNVPLVAASQGMYSLSEYPANASLWNLITYCAATGGSLLVIGSAAGVAFLGMEKKANFGWYVQTILPGALIGYFAGIFGCVAQSSLGLSLK